MHLRMKYAEQLLHIFYSSILPTVTWELSEWNQHIISIFFEYFARNAYLYDQMSHGYHKLHELSKYTGGDNGQQ